MNILTGATDSLCNIHAEYAMYASIRLRKYRGWYDESDHVECREMWKRSAAQEEQLIINRANSIIGIRSGSNG